MDAEGLLRALGADGTFEHTPTGYWAHRPDLDVRAMAEFMNAHEVRLVTMTGTLEPSGALRIIYHWDHNGMIINIATTATTGHVPTISDILPAADWVEREIRDYYGPKFDGRPSTKPLMLREGDPPGLFTRTAGQGTQTDPAQTAHAQIARAHAALAATSQEEGPR